jgi:V/A-type H+-transporting ATPase subunit A
MRRLIERPYEFSDKEQIREYFTRLTGLYKNLNYAQWKSDSYHRLLSQIEALEQAALTKTMPEKAPFQSVAGGTMK